MCSSPKTNVKGNIIDGKLESYFRGRKLRGQELDLPQGYRGVIVKEAGKEKTAPQSHDKGDIEGEEGEEEQEEVTMLEEVGSFEKMVIWNHESMVNGDDAFVKGVSEWIGFAEAVRLPITYPESITVADKTHRPDACTSRKDFVKMDIESFRFLQCELKAQKVATCP